MTIQHLLKDLGLKDPEIRLYMALLDSGPLLAGDLAKRLSLPRASLYGFLGHLLEQGLIAQSLTASGVKQFDAESPAKIVLMLDQRIDALKEKRERYQTILAAAERHQLRRRIKPTFQLYEGSEGVKNILRDSLLYHDLESEAFWPAKVMTETLSPELFAYFNKHRIKNNFSIRAIWPPSQVADLEAHPYLGTGKGFKREIRVAPKGVDFPLGYWIYGHRVAFVSSYKESIGFVIESTELAETLRASFDFMWRASKPLKVTAKQQAATDRFLREIGEA